MKLCFAALTLLALAACSPAANAPAPVDPGFAKAVRDYLIANPEVIEEAQAALSQKRQMALFKDAIADSSDPFIGAKDAKVTVVEFFDYRCTYCVHAADWVLALPAKNKNVRVIFKEMPFLTPSSVEASQAALAANKQGKYAKLHRALMHEPAELSSSKIDKLAASVGIDVKKMRKDMGTHSVIAHLERVKSLAVSAKVESTPTFLVNGVLINGFDEKALNDAIEKATAS